jgi:hypothetical protein
MNFWQNTMLEWPSTDTIVTTTASTPYAASRTISVSVSPRKRVNAPANASPPVQMLSAANATDADASRIDPINRPATPKNAPLETGLLVPVRGPIRPVGASSAAPTAEPTITAVAACHQLSPKLIGNQPMMITLNVSDPPNRMLLTLRGEERRSFSGMYSTP